MNVYVALLRGINVGGKSVIKMAELTARLEDVGLHHVKPYIQSGNIIFASDKERLDLTELIEKLILKKFSLAVPVLIFSYPEYEKIIKNVPNGWGESTEWKYNLLFLLPPYNEAEIISDIGELKPEIESLTAGRGVIYQSMSIKMFGRTTSGKLASNTIYKRMTVRNHRTGNKILELMKECDKIRGGH